jgi:TfoX/Sxy family transcriptional regulator of competence genes
MGYDEALADRVRDQISARANISEKRMFGSNCFLVEGNLAVCVRKDELLVRLDPEDAERAIAEEGVRVAEMGSRRMKGWVFIAAERVSEDDCLAEWVEAGAAFAASLPSK